MKDRSLIRCGLFVHASVAFSVLLYLLAQLVSMILSVTADEGDKVQSRDIKKYVWPILPSKMNQIKFNFCNKLFCTNYEFLSY